MSEKSDLSLGSIDPRALLRASLIGWAIGFLVISFFVFGVDSPNPDWSRYWMIRPLIITPLAGACGGAVFYFMNHLRRHYGWNVILVNVICFVIAFIGLWMGIVLGLVGTMWH
jgi:hypothetical protein